MVATAAAILGIATVSHAQNSFLNEIAFFQGVGTPPTPDPYQYDNLSSGYGTPISPMAAPGGVDTSGLNTVTGLGTISYTSTSLGPQYFGLFVNIDNDINSSIAFDDVASSSGTPAAGVSWEIGDDEGGPPDPFDDAYTDTLANANTMTEVPQEGDLAMALGFDFDNTEAGTETITITSSLTAPSSGFYLEEQDAQDLADGDSQPNYLYATETFTPNGQLSTPDGGSTWATLALGLMGLKALKQRLMRK